jgi:hypothetical protein
LFFFVLAISMRRQPPRTEQARLSRCSREPAKTADGRSRSAADGRGRTLAAATAPADAICPFESSLPETSS